MNELLTRPDFSNTVHNTTSAALACEAQRNRLCELRQDPGFAEWWHLTLALGLEDCLLLLAGELAAAPLGDTSALAKALASLARMPIGAAEGDEDRWLNPLFPLLLPDEPLPLSLPLAAPLNSIAASAD
jgi:hypothetical protein